MEIIPAIDIRNGKCVRLHQGDYQKETVYSDNPVAIAKQWKTEGASWLHVVDLDGAAKGIPINLPLVSDIIEATNMNVELGGGFRQEEHIVGAIKSGIKRIVLGTIAIENPKLVRKLCEEFNDSIVVSLDAKNGNIATHGWKKITYVPALELANNMVELGIKRLVYTDISKDGTLTTPNFEAVKRLVGCLSIPITASGGISNIEHIRILKEIGVESVIIGKALYTGDIDLRKAILQTEDMQE
jgi:phosphoribosylformimino-5-aminoimidazole carboxamide ribotide isomerase